MNFHLTSSQRNFYIDKFDSSFALWNQGGMDIFNRVYDYNELNTAFNSLMKTFDNLRLRFDLKSAEPRLYVDEFCFKEYPVLFFETEEDLYEASNQFTSNPIKLNEELIKCIIFQTPTKSGFIFTVHHIIIDGFSTQIMADFFDNYLNGRPYIPEKIQSYEDYVKSEEIYKNSNRYNRDRKFWEEQFSTEPVCDAITQGRNEIDYSSQEVNGNIPCELFVKISEFCGKNDISLNSFFEAIISLYVSRKYEVENFTLGVPVLNRTTLAEMNTIGLYMHILPLVCNMESVSFAEFAKQTEDNKLNLFRHQKFTQTDIKELLKENGKSKNNLFEVAFSYQDFTSNENYEFVFQYSNALSLPLEIHLQNFNDETHNLKIRYRTAMFTEQEIKIMLKSIIALAENAIENPEKTVYELEMVSAEEKKKLLYDFNNTSADYAKDKCIHELFEEQTERTPDKVALVASDKKLTYKELNEEANRIAHSLIEKGIGKGDIVGIKLGRTSKFLVSLLGILKTGAAYLPLDPDHPQDRIKTILEDSSAKLCITEENFDELTYNSNTEKPDIKISGDDLCYCIYTSGSTGTPKGAMIQHKNVCWYMHALMSIYGTDPINMPFFTSTSVDLSVPSYLLPLVTGGTTYFYDNDLLVDLADIVNNEEINTIKVTPTHLQIMLQHIEGRTLHNMKYLISGGESLRQADCIEFLEKFGEHIEIHNEYGPTEATVSCVDYLFSRDDTDHIVSIGAPIDNAQIYIVDKYMNLLPLGVTGEICIAGDGVCAGYLNNPELTEEKFVDNPFGEGKLYKTGDLAFWREDGKLTFVGRNDFQVKIRGLRIEFGEIENAVLNVDGVVQCAVVVRTDANDRQFICAFYTGAETKAIDFRTILGTKLPKYMIPHIFTRLDEMPLTSSGKISRNSFPEIDLESISTETEYVSPETDEEKALVNAIKAVLNVEEVSMLDNFFNMGGDSITAIYLVSELEDSGYGLNVADIMQSDTLQEIAGKIKIKTTTKESIEYADVLPATAAQMRIYTAHFTSDEPTLYNLSSAFKMENFDADRFENAVNQLIARHEGLRTSFENRNGQIFQIINDNAYIKIEKLDSPNLSDFIRPFDLTKAPLMRVGYIDNTVIVDFHHIISDGSTFGIFYEEINELYMGRELPEAVQYREFAVNDTYTKEDEEYWLNEFEEIPDFELYTDFPEQEAKSDKGINLYTKIDQNLHENILIKCKEWGVTPYAYYMGSVSILLSKYSGSEDVCVGVTSNGRSSKFLNTWGMFVNMLSIRTKPESEKTFKDFVNEIKNKSFNAIAHQSYPQQELLKKLNIRKSLYDVMFIYQSEKMTHSVIGDKKAELIPVTISTSRAPIMFYIHPREEDTLLRTEYLTDLFKAETIDKLIASYMGILTQALDEKALIKDITVLGDVEKEKLLNDFNNTDHEYDVPDNSTLYSLFEVQAEKNKEKVCLKADNKEITFGDFKAYAERIDNKVREITNNEKSVIAVICERSFEMYGAIYGIIRGGNAYLPIDPNYPQERIDYILSNSNAKAVITQDKFCHLAGNVPCINATEVLNNKETIKETEILANEDDTAYVIYTSGSTGNPKGAKISHKSAVNRILWMDDFYPMEENDVILQKTPYTFDVSVWELFWWGIKGRTLCASKPDEHFLPAKILQETEKNKVTHLHFVPSVFELFLTYLENNPDEQYKFNSVKYVFLSGEALTANSINRFYNIYDYNKVSLHNLYGPTECAVDVSYYDCKPEDIDPVPIGKPIYNTQLYVVDKYLNPTPIGVTGELCIGGVNVGQGYLNNEELTKEKFIDNPFHEGKIYKTGDLAYIREDGEIIFCGRKDHQIKLNGQRIELGEIENALSSVDGVVQCAVIVKEQYICAFYTGECFDSKSLRSILSSRLPRYMLPHSLMHIDEMPMTVSGKLDRKALPEIDLNNISTDIEYVAPETAEEIVLTSVLADVLTVEDVSVLDNFFNIGGDSITAIYVVSELEDLGYEINVADIMQSETLAEAARGMKPIKEKTVYDQNEINGFIPFSPIMQTFLRESNGVILNDFVHTAVISADCDETIVRKTIDVLASHHDILRGTFTDNGIEILSLKERVPYSFSSIVINDTNEATECLKNAKLEDDKLINVVFCKTDKENLVGITVHHFLIDLVSWEILMKDFTTVVKQLKNNEKITLSAKTASFKLWSDELQEYSVVIPEENREYWKEINNKLDNTKSFCSDEDENTAEEFSFTFEKEISEKLIKQVNKTYGTRINEVLLTTLGLAACKLAEGNVGIIVESHGRTELHKPISTERTIGWFTSCYPVVVNDNINVAEELVNVKDTMRRIPKNGVEYLLLNNGFHNNAHIKFNFYKNTVSNENRENKLVEFNGSSSVFPNMINVGCSVMDNILSVFITVPICKHKKGISEELGKEFIKQVEKIVDICTATDTVTKTRSDFSDDTLTQSELDELMDLFN